MRFHKYFATCLVVAAAAAGTGLRAQESAPPPGDDDPGIIEAPPVVVHVQERRTDPDDGPAGTSPKADGATRALEDPAFVTVVRMDHRRDETISAAEVLAETVGVTVRSLGGMGAFASISMRGAPSGQTEILIDGVPLSQVAFSSIDVGSLDLSTFDRLEVYRGGVPADLGGAVLGGAVNFTTNVGPDASGRKNDISLGFGSFGARQARVSRGDSWDDGKIKSTIAVGYSGATGDFSYFDDNGTPLNPGDDTTKTRTDNGYDQLDAVARVALRDDAGASLELGDRFSYKNQGVAGPTGTSALHATLTTTRDLFDVHGKQPSLFGTPSLTASAHAYFIYEGQRYQDPDAEIYFIPADNDFRTYAGAFGGGLDYALPGHQRLSAAIEGKLESFSETDNLATDPAAAEFSGRRLSGSLALSDEIVLGAADQLVLIPALRGDLASTRGEGLPNPVIGNTAPDARDDAFFSPRFSARWRVVPAVTVKGNVGMYYRPPTVIELFGNRGFVNGNPALKPESGVNGDLGVVVAPEKSLGVVDRLYLEGAGFFSDTTDLITFLPTSGRTSRAENVEDAHILGLEAVASARFFRALSLTGNYTWLDARQASDMVSTDGKLLPGRPQNEIYLRADLARRFGAAHKIEVGAFTDFTFVSGNFLDEGNTSEVPERRFVGVGVHVSPLPGLTLTFECKNLFDDTVEYVTLATGMVPRAVADVLDYPLPGRSFYGTADWSF